MADLDITGCEASSPVTLRLCLGCSNAQNKLLLFNKYKTRVGSRACIQFAILTGCGCLNDSGIGFVKPLKIVNPPGLTASNCPVKVGARNVKSIPGCEKSAA